MKKGLSILTAGVLLAGALASFAGCESAVTDEALIARVYEAVENAQISSFEASSSVEVKYVRENMDGTLKINSETQSKIKAYEKDGQIFADVFTDDYSYAVNRSVANTIKTTEKNYSVDFIRGDETYSAAGEWEDVSAKRGNFSALVKELKNKDAELMGSYQLPSAFTFDGEDVQSFGAFAREANAKVSKSGSAYLVKMDAKEALKVEDLGLEELLGSDGKMEGDITIRLDSALNVTATSVEIDFRAKENSSITSKVSTSVEFEMEFKVLKEAPALTDLTGMTANMGERIPPRQYEISIESLYVPMTSSGVAGSLVGTATVTENNRLIVEVTFTEKYEGATLSERREYDLRVFNDDSDRLFEGKTLTSGGPELLGVYYSLYTYAGSRETYAYLVVGDVDLELDSEGYTKTL